MTEIFEDAQMRVEAIALEALRDIFHRIPFGEEITFSDGRKGIISKFYEPKITNDGAIKAGIDIKDVEGNWHLEFILQKTGWGCAPGALGAAPDMPIPEEPTQ